MEDEDVEEVEKKPPVTCIRCGRPMEYGTCDCNELVYIYWEM